MGATDDHGFAWLLVARPAWTEATVTRAIELLETPPAPSGGHLAVLVRDGTVGAVDGTVGAELAVGLRASLPATVAVTFVAPADVDGLAADQPVLVVDADLVPEPRWVQALWAAPRRPRSGRRRTGRRPGGPARPRRRRPRRPAVRCRRRVGPRAHLHRRPGRRRPPRPVRGPGGRAPGRRPGAGRLPRPRRRRLAPPRSRGGAGRAVACATCSARASWCWATARPSTSTTPAAARCARPSTPSGPPGSSPSTAGRRVGTPDGRPDLAAWEARGDVLFGGDPAHRRPRPERLGAARTHARRPRGCLVARGRGPRRPAQPRARLPRRVGRRPRTRQRLRRPRPRGPGAARPGRGGGRVARRRRRRRGPRPAPPRPHRPAAGRRPLRPACRARSRAWCRSSSRCGTSGA